jgi:hypothetical protein
MNRQEAKKLFLQYDGSRFFMSRDGVESDYLGAGVPRKVEKTWLEELKRKKLRQLSKKGNWWVLCFFRHHEDLGHLADFVQAEPEGVLWERCAYLEELLTYASEVKEIGRDSTLVAQAVRKAILEAERLLKRAKSNDSTKRVRDILRQARHQLRGIAVD